MGSLGGPVYVGTEKYGRLLADVYFGGRHLNAWLVEQRYALPYDGGTKQVPDSWVHYHATGERVQPRTAV